MDTVSAVRGHGRETDRREGWWVMPEEVSGRVPTTMRAAQDLRAGEFVVLDVSTGLLYPHRETVPAFFEKRTVVERGRLYHGEEGFRFCS